jgi:hypothetical protein
MPPDETQDFFYLFGSVSGSSHEGLELTWSFYKVRHLYPRRSPPVGWDSRLAVGHAMRGVESYLINEPCRPDCRLK